MKFKNVSKAFKISQIVLWSLGFILSCIEKTTAIGIFLIIIAVITIIAYIVFSFSRKGLTMYSEQEAERSRYFSFIQSTRLRGNRLVIKQRGSIIIEAIKIEESRDYTYKDVADKLIYTGATVGGVTTGGFHVQKGGIAITSMKKNGKFYLSYALIPSYEYKDPSLTFIELTDSDFKKFQRTSINHLITTEEIKKEYNLVGKNIIDASDLSKNDAYALKEWLCGKDYYIEGKEDEESVSYQSGWKCPYCGKVNQDFMENCFDCGKTRPSVIENEDGKKDNGNDRPEINFFTDKWKCPDCGKNNPNSITFCSCGKEKPW